jgi:hypothetical protein
VKKQTAKYAKMAMETQWRPVLMGRKHWLISWVITTVIRPLPFAGINTVSEQKAFELYSSQNLCFYADRNIADK